MTRFVIDLDGSEARLIRLLKHLLKVLGRAHDVKCRSVKAVSDGDANAH